MATEFNTEKSNKGGYAQMANDQELEIAVRRKQDFLNQFSNLIFELNITSLKL